MSRAPARSRSAAGLPKPQGSAAAPPPLDLSTLDLSTLPATGFRSHGLWFWAGMAFMLMEGAGFALACAAYAYLMNGADQWPLDGRPPALFWGSAMTVLLLGSLIPNGAASRAARRRDLAGARRWAAAMSGIAVAAMVVRAIEFGRLHARWDFDAYGSVVWALILLHTLHILTDAIDTLGLTVFLFTHPVDDERFADVDDNAAYWSFVVAAWVPVYLLIYWAPRWSP
jgi:heme/copper-type cytochrome/quinol oxidase subunit 3